MEFPPVDTPKPGGAATGYAQMRGVPAEGRGGLLSPGIPRGLPQPQQQYQGSDNPGIPNPTRDYR